jgi:hypothetical protein
MIINSMFHYFNNPHLTFTTQATFFFSLGVLFGPISLGILWFLLSIIVYEIICWFFMGSCEIVKWSLPQRLALELIALIGWILGRLVYTGKPC